MIGGHDAPRRRRRAGRPRRAEPGPAAVEITRATVIDAEPLGDPETWLERATGAEAERVTGDALALLNRAVAGQRVASADPWLPDADPAHAIVCRVGYGSGEQVADGDWEAALELPLPAARGARSLVLSPQERLAALLSGRDAALACEELTLRARGDLDHGRPREAALQLAIALNAALAELEVWRDQGDMAERLEELRRPARRCGARRRGGASGWTRGRGRASMEAALGRLEAALRARQVAEARTSGL